MGSIREYRGVTFAIFTLVLAQISAGAQGQEPYGNPNQAGNVAQYGGADQFGQICQATCGSDPCTPAVIATVPRMPWYAQVEGLLLRRDVRGNSAVATVEQLLTGTEPMNPVLCTGDLDQPFGGGGKLLVGHTFGDSPVQLEATYFAVSAFEGEAAVRDTTDNGQGSTGNMYSPFSRFGNPAAIAGVDYNSLVSIRDYSTLHNAELNLVFLLPYTPGRLTTSALFGVRYVDIDEEFNYYSESSVPVVGVTNSVDTRTRNALVGPQIGAIGKIYIETNWWVDFTIKGAICNNSASQNTMYTNVGGTLNGQYGHERSRNVTSYLGELDLALVYRWSPGFAARVGYQATWIEGLALAQDNFNQDLGFLTSGPSWLEHDGRVVYHGIHAGLEFAW